jgi:hypothetical protein
MTRTADLRRAVIALTTTAGALAAQAPRAVRLEVRPRPGDTLHVTLVHEVVVEGAGLPGFAETVRVQTRDVVERADPYGTEVRAIVDSVQVGRGAAYAPGGARALGVRLHIAPDGATTVHEGLDALHPTVRPLFGAAPAVLPADAVAVDAVWVRHLPLPTPAPGAGAAGTLRVVFRLDSLRQGGAIAWISLRGSVAPARDGALAATVAGTIVLDRVRGWIVLASTRLTGVLPAAPGDPPRRFRLTQRMSTRPRG